MKKYDIAIIGAGASGLMAALKASNSNKSVVVVEGNTKQGKKLLTTGNGRCNIANKNIDISHFHGDSDEISELLKLYPWQKIAEEFEKIGIFFVADNEGRLYPKSLQATSVLKALSDSLAEKAVNLITDFKLETAVKQKNLFILTAENGLSFSCEKLILACGGMASPKHSGNTFGYEIAKQLGHSVTKLMPTLTKFSCEDKFIKPLSGVKAKCKASLMHQNKEVYSEVGEMIFGDKTLSGICLFNLSIHANKYFAKGENLKIKFDFMPKDSEDLICENVYKIIKNRPLMQCGDILNGFLNSKLGFSLVKKSGIDPMLEIKFLSEKQVLKIVHMIKSFSLEVSFHKKWETAQVTDGGIPLKEIDVSTMQSKICPSLYFAGEILNIHGDCGGYNLYWAWLCGMIAGENATTKVIRI